MPTRHLLLLGIIVGLLVGIFGALTRRPAPLRSAKVTAISLGDPPFASIALSYGPGVAPTNLIIDIQNGSSSTGSATIDGQQLFVDVLLHDIPETCQVSATATHRWFGRQLRKTYTFPTTRV